MFLRPDGCRRPCQKRLFSTPAARSPSPLTHAPDLSEATWMSSPLPDTPLFYPGHGKTVTRTIPAGSFCRDHSRFDTLALSVPCSYPATVLATPFDCPPGLSDGGPSDQRRPSEARPLFLARPHLSRHPTNARRAFSRGPFNIRHPMSHRPQFLTRLSCVHPLLNRSRGPVDFRHPLDLRPCFSPGHSFRVTRR